MVVDAASGLHFFVFIYLFIYLSICLFFVCNNLNVTLVQRVNCRKNVTKHYQKCIDRPKFNKLNTAVKKADRCITSFHAL